MTKFRRTPLGLLVAGLFASTSAFADDQAIQPVLMAAAPPATPVLPGPVAAPLGGQILTLEVQVNGRAFGAQQVLDRQGLLFVQVQKLQTWGIVQRMEVVGLQDAGQTWYPLSAIRGAETRYSPNDRALYIKVSPASLLSVPVEKGSVSVTAAPGVQQVVPPLSPRLVRSDRLLPMEVVVNGANMGSWVLLDRQATLYAPEDAFPKWRMSGVPATASFEYKGQRWVALSSFPGFKVDVRHDTQTVDLTFAPEVFAATRITDSPPPPPPITPAIPMGFVNYDLSYSTQSNKGSGGTAKTSDLGAALELGISGNLGVLTSSYVGRGLESSDHATNPSWRRLETTYTRDFLEQGLTLRIGDSTTRYGLMTNSLYFGGVQLGTNHGLRPGFVTQPLPIIAGSSIAPSTVDLYINDALRKTSPVPSGPFTLENLNSISGAGQARVVVKDILGRETVITQDFFTDGRLLKMGLSEWSAELGKLRRNMGTLNADYGDAVASGLYRYGLSDATTFEGSAQVSRAVKQLGFGLTQALPGQLLGQFGLSLSQADTVGNGYQHLAGVEYHGRRHAYTMRVQGYSRDYRRVGGDASASQDLRRLLSASYSYNPGSGWGSFGFGAARSESYTSPALNTFTANYSTTLGQRNTLMLSMTRVTGASKGTAVGANLVIPLDGGLISSSGVSKSSGNAVVAYTSLQKPLSEEIGVGWRTLVGTQGGKAWGEANVQYQGSYALLTADAAVTSQTQALRLGLRGGLAVADGRFVLSRRVENAMAFVEVPGFADVGIGLQGGGDLTRTDDSGIALLPRLVPYYENRIQLNTRNLPISAEIDNTEMSVVPANRTAVKVAFPVRTGRAALIKLVLDDGQPAPAGAELELVGDKREFFVARRGEAFVTGMKDSGELRLKHKDQTCTVKVMLPPAKEDDIARVGPLTCSGVKR